MKHLFFSISILTMVISSCTNETATTTSNSDTDSIPTPSITKTEVPTPKPTSQYVSLNETTYIGKVALSQEKTFLNLVSSKQTAFKTENNDQAHRSDTLYAVSYIPYKDQEVYLYQAVFTQTDGSSSNWCFSIIKNGEVLINEHIIAQGKFTNMVLKEMKLGDPALEFMGTTPAGTEETISLPYDGKSIQ